MHIRCQNCGERLVAPPLQPTETTAELICHACGVTMRVRRPAAPAKDPHAGRALNPAEGEPRPSEHTWRRVFEPVPRLLIYLAGFGVAVVLLSPFWVVWLQERYARNPIILSDDTADIAMSPATNPAMPIMTVPDLPSTTLDQYHNVRLEAGREDVQHRFNLTLQNTRGMEPEIYEATKGIEFERFTAHFYNSTMKEVWLVRREQRTFADAIQKDLVEQFSAPVEQSEIAGPLPSSSPFSLGGNELARKLEGFAFHRSLIWTDAQYRVEAVIHYSSADPAECRSMLALHMSAYAWLKKRQPLR
ncbi:MAG: hypothetical protein FJ395_00245 [Verrucomicrobia bacterium]|nr:hypothetical protein [Verrucomicrobiota bacterium]